MNKQLLNCPDRRNSDSLKWGHFGEEVLPLWVADMDFASPTEVIQALHDRVTHGVFGYASEPTKLVELVVERMQRLYDWRINNEDVLLISGVIAGFNLVCQSANQSGGSILIQPPIYPPFFQVAKNAHAREIQCGLVRQADGTYEIDFDALENAFASDTHCFLFCNPHNPVGKTYSRTELEKIADICLRKNVLICSDEIHSDILFSGNKHIPIASISHEVGKHTVTLIAPSKTFNIAGLECSILICTNQELMTRLKESRRGLLGGINLLGATAGIAAYQYGQPWLEELIKYLETNRDFLFEYLQTNIPAIKMQKPDATYLAWLDCRDLMLNESPFKYFLREAKVGLNRGADFGIAYEGFVRMNFGCDRQVLEEALKRMRTIVTG
jgi:cystathionine beta-lyase